MSIVSKNQIIRLCAKSLRLYDSRLVDHGERVAYIAKTIAEQMTPEDFDKKTLMILSVFHDAGAYKTEEIDRMVEFETVNVQAHSIYGYLFLKYFTPIGTLSQSILYHHTDSRELENVDEEVRRYAEIIYLADRVDIAIANGYTKEKALRKLKVPQFNQRMLVALEKAWDTTSLYESVKSGEAKNNTIETMSSLPISTEESVQYLKMLVYSSDFKSEFTVVHSVNTTVISLYLAWRLGLDEKSMENIYYAALIHDVGKMAIPEEILEYPGRLSPEQMEIMRKHVVYTEEIIKGILPEEIVHIAVRHHEKLDGTGYPLGMKADALSESDRIIAVADVISALGSKRSYKDAYGKEKILGILQDLAERGQLDQGIVSLTSQYYDDMQIVMQEYTAPIYDIYDGIQKEYMELIQK